MYDVQILAELNAPEVRPPIFVPDWQPKFELDLHWPLIEERLRLDVPGRFAEHERARFHHHLIDCASPYCHFWEDDFIYKAKHRTLAF